MLARRAPRLPRRSRGSRAASGPARRPRCATRGSRAAHGWRRADGRRPTPRSRGRRRSPRPPKASRRSGGRCRWRAVRAVASSRTWDGSTSSTCSLMRRSVLRAGHAHRFTLKVGRVSYFRKCSARSRTCRSVPKPRAPPLWGAPARCTWGSTRGRGRFGLGGIRVQLLLIAVSAEAPAADMGCAPHLPRHPCAAPNPHHAGPRRQRADRHRDGLRHQRRGPAQPRPPRGGPAPARARRRAPGDGAHERLADAPPLRAAGAADRRHGAHGPGRARRTRRPPRRRGRGGRPPAGRLRGDARPPRGRARPHRQRGPPGPGDRARPRRPRPARRGQPVAHRRPAAPGGDVGARPPEGLRAELRETQAVATQAMEELLRLSRELRPAALDDLGLGAALRSKVEDFGRTAGIVTRLHLPTAASRPSAPRSRSSSTASSRRACPTSRATRAPHR